MQILLRFPISTVQYEEEYMLGIEFDWTQSLQDAISGDTAFTAQTFQSQDVIVFDGTLNGDVTIKTDGRATIYEPLVTTKLNFNLVSHNFPSWIMEATYYYTNVRVVLASKIKNEWVEQWRGYLWGNTLNSTVVDDWITTSIFALDEISMSKYIKVAHTIGDYSKSRRLWNYFAFYKSFNDANFGHIYTYMDLSSTDLIYWDNELCVRDESNNEQPDLLGDLYLDDYIYVNYDDEKELKPWNDLFGDVCDILGVTFSIGGYDNNPKDSYLITTQDITTISKDYSRIIHDNESHTGYTVSSGNNFTTITPSEKVNADFNITLQPQQYRGDSIISDVKRYELHSYLDENNYEIINKTKPNVQGFGTYVKGQESVTKRVIEDWSWRKFYYTKPTYNEENYIDLSYNYDNSGANNNLDYLRRMGYFGPMDINEEIGNLTYPNAATADKMAFLNCLNGAVTMKLGEFIHRSDEEDLSLKDYLLLMNNAWYHAGWTSFELAQGTIYETENHRFVGFKPFKNNYLKPPTNKSYLKIDLEAMFLDENIGTICYPHFDTFPEPSSAFSGTTRHIFPALTTNYEYFDDDGLHGLGQRYYNTVSDEDIFGVDGSGYSPYLVFQIHCGDYFLTNQGWTNNTGSTDNCKFKLWSDDVKVEYYTNASYGYENRVTSYNNLYLAKTPYDLKYLLIPINGIPVDAPIEVWLLGPLKPYARLDDRHPWNGNIIYTLISKLDFSITDDAEIMGLDTKLEEMDIYDPISKTKTIRERELNLCTPQKEGYFSNCFTYFYGKWFANATKFFEQSGLYGATAEYFLLKKYTHYDYPNPMSVDLTMRYKATDPYFHNQLIISGLTETSGEQCVVREKIFNVTKNIINFKADRIINSGNGSKNTPSTDGDAIDIDDIGE